MQDLPDLTLSDASSESFTVALGQSVAVVLKVPASSVSNVRIKAKRRMLLSGVSVTYIVTIVSGRTTQDFIDALHESESSGSFATSLSTNSGVQINSASGLIVIDMSESSSPTASPSTDSDTTGKLSSLRSYVKNLHMAE